jgi:hypothetical protein
VAALALIPSALAPPGSGAHPAVYAHAAWFVQGTYPPDWSFTLQRLTLAELAAVLVLCVTARLAGGVRVRGHRVQDGVALPGLARLAPYMPFCVRLHAGVSLIVLTSLGLFLTPAMHLHRTPKAYALAALMLAIGTLLLAGWQTRLAAWMLLAAIPLGMLEYGDVPVLIGSTLSAGSALYLLLAGAGRWSADWELGCRAEPGPADLARGVWALRMGAGLALVLGGFTEKLAVPLISLAFLRAHPAFDFLAGAGIHVSSIEFVRAMGAMEVLLGLVVILGVLPQAGVVAASVPFTATVIMLGAVELAGHLQAHAILIVLFVYAADPALRTSTWTLWPWTRGAHGVREAIRRRAGGRLARDAMET